MLKRSTFKRPVLERVRTVHKPIPLDQRRGSMKKISEASAPVAKFDYVRSRPLLKAVASLRSRNA